MKKVGIQTPCEEKWANMSPTNKGAFCQSCSKEVVDFSDKSMIDIKRILLQNGNAEMCGRMTVQQETALSKEFDLWKMNSQQQVRRISLYAFILVFGLSIVSCADEQDKVAIHQLHQTTQELLSDSVPEIAEEVVEVSIQESKNIDLIEVVQSKSTECSINQVEVSFEHYSLDSVIYTQDRIVQYTMGIMIAPTRYIEYIEDTLPPVRYDENGIEIPTEFSGLVYPNPSNGISKLKIATPTTEKATIIVYSSRGELIRDFGQHTFREGTSEVEIDLTNEQAGNYIIQYITEARKQTFRVIKL